MRPYLSIPSEILDALESEDRLFGEVAEVPRAIADPVAECLEPLLQGGDLRAVSPQREDRRLVVAMRAVFRSGSVSPPFVARLLAATPTARGPRGGRVAWGSCNLMRANDVVGSSA